MTKTSSWPDGGVQVTSAPAFPDAAAYASERARHSALEVVDIRAGQAAVAGSYDNRVLFDVNDDCMRMAVFEGEYRWHCHPDSDELFLVVAGELRIDVAAGATLTLREWQGTVVPAGTVHRTRAIGRTVNLTVERQGARTVFVDPPPAASPSTGGREPV